MFYGQCNICGERWELGTASTCKCKEDENDNTQVYKKPWVGLTDEEFDFLVPYCENKWDLEDYKTFAKDIEAKLKEKNT